MALTTARKTRSTTSRVATAAADPTSTAFAHSRTPPALAYPDISAFAAAVGIGRTQVYEEIKTGRLKVAKVGRRTIVPIAEAERWLAARMSETGE